MYLVTTHTTLPFPPLAPNKGHGVMGKHLQGLEAYLKDKRILRHAPKDNMDDLTVNLLVTVMTLEVKDKHPFPIVAPSPRTGWRGIVIVILFFFFFFFYLTLHRLIGGAPWALLFPAQSTISHSTRPHAGTPQHTTNSHCIPQTFGMSLNL